MENIIDLNYVNLCKVWLNQVKLSNPEKIFVLYNKNYPSFLDHEPSVELVRCEYDKSIQKLQIDDNNYKNLNHFFISFKLFNLYKINPPFIHLDVDAIPIQDLNLLWNIKTDKPFLASGWQNLIGFRKHFSRYNISDSPKSVVAGGVLLVKDLSFMPYEELIDLYNELIKDKKNHLIMQDDILMTFFFRNLKYCFKHDDFTCRWNFIPSSIKKITNFNNQLIVSISDDDKKVEQGAVIHYTGVSKKPWLEPCKIYNYFLKKYNFHNI